MGNQRMHDGLCGVVAQQMRDRKYDLVLKNKCYTDRPHSLFGEVDVLAQKDKYLLIFECKCNDYPPAIKRAKGQLDRAERYYNLYYPGFRVFKIMVHWNNHEPEYRWIKRR